MKKCPSGRTNPFFRRRKCSSAKKHFLLLKLWGIILKYQKGLRLLSWGIRAMLLLWRRRRRNWRGLEIIGLRIIRNSPRRKVLRNFRLQRPRKVKEVCSSWARVQPKGTSKTWNQKQQGCKETSQKAEEHHSTKEKLLRRTRCCKMHWVGVFLSSGQKGWDSTMWGEQQIHLGLWNRVAHLVGNSNHSAAGSR